MTITITITRIINVLVATPFLLVFYCQTSIKIAIGGNTLTPVSRIFR